MKWLLTSCLFISFSASATCMFFPVEEAQCSNGQGAGGPKTILAGLDKCPGKSGDVRCQSQPFNINGKQYTPVLKQDHQGQVDWCGYVKCSAPPGGGTNGGAVQIKQDRMI